MLARIIVVPLDPFSTKEFINRIAEETQAAFWIAEAQTQFMTGLPGICLYDLPLDKNIQLFEERPQPDDIAEIVFTSGTTGSPKGVTLTHRNILSNVLSSVDIFPKGVGWRFLSLLPLSHMFEQTVGLFIPLLIKSMS